MPAAWPKCSESSLNRGFLHVGWDWTDQVSGQAIRAPGRVSGSAACSSCLKHAIHPFLHSNCKQSTGECGQGPISAAAAHHLANRNGFPDLQTGIGRTVRSRGESCGSLFRYARTRKTCGHHGVALGQLVQADRFRRRVASGRKLRRVPACWPAPVLPLCVASFGSRFRCRDRLQDFFRACVRRLARPLPDKSRLRCM